MAKTDKNEAKKINSLVDNKLSILLIAAGVAVIIFAFIQATKKDIAEQPAPIPAEIGPAEKPSETVAREEVIEETPGEVEEISEDIKELLSLADKKIQSVSYKYKGPQTKNFLYEFSVKEDKIKYAIFPAYKNVELDDDAYDTIYLDKESETALAYCDGRKCRVKGMKTELDYNESYIWTPFDWLNNIESAEKTGEELIDRRNTWKLATNLGTVWVDTFFGVPLQAEFGDNIYQFVQFSFNSVKNEDVTPSGEVVVLASKKYECVTNEDCVKFNTCSEECVDRVWKENNPYTGLSCGIPWEYGCECIENKCQIGEKI